jgi:zinc transport system ATP-binding protein
VENTLIEIKNLSIGYNGKKVLEDVNLNIEHNDFIGVIGPNGGGKTTLIKAVLGLIDKWSGQIKYNIKKSEIGYLPQFTPFDKEFPISIKEVVLSGLTGKKGILKKYTETDMQQAEYLLQQAEIVELKNKPIGNVSGGQMQRALLCRALIGNPKLLILDEPGNFVDNKFEHELFKWLKKLNDKMAILMVSHDLGTISQHVKTIACVNFHLHYHKSNKITEEQLKHYNCPIKIIAHGDIPHQVLKKHDS